MRKKIELKDALIYMAFQIAGAFAAAWIAYLLTGNSFAPAPKEGINILKPLAIEMAFTFALVSVVLNVATSKKSAGNSYFGIAIGFTVLAAAFAGGPISGGAYNPAVALGPMIADTIHGGGSIANLWLYLAGPFTGGAVAAVVYRMTNPDEA
jgi:aquaporin Z